jgi:hypothetical protein
VIQASETRSSGCKVFYRLCDVSPVYQEYESIPLIAVTEKFATAQNSTRADLKFAALKQAAAEYNPE